MNFLAHTFLSGNDDKILVGNFIADFVKGKTAMAAYDGGIKKGIELHRAIDFFTDSHPVVAESKKRLRPKYRHYAGVIVDVFYDHYLAKNWNDFSITPLEDFAAHTYSILQSHQTVIPADVNHMLPYMIKGNWLVNYGKTQGIARALSGMSRRTPYDSKMDEAVQDLVGDYTLFEAEFTAFFPQLRAHVDDFMAKG